jgi:hypothetical protein
MKSLLILISLTAKILMATEYIYYCDRIFDNEKTYKKAIQNSGSFNFDELSIRLTYELGSDEVSFTKEGVNITLTSISYNEEDKMLILRRERGTGVGRIGTGYRFISDSSCYDNKAKFEQYNIGGFAGGTITSRLNCVCPVD